MMNERMSDPLPVEEENQAVEWDEEWDESFEIDDDAGIDDDDPELDEEV